MNSQDVYDISSNKILIGLAGLIGSGKSTVASYLEEKGYKVITFSELIKSELKKLNLEVTRENLQRVGEEYRERFGGDYWARLVDEEVKKTRWSRFVLDGLRTMDEVRYFREEYNDRFFLIGIIVDERKRFERLKKKMGELSISEFKKINSQPSEREIPDILKKVDYKVDNNGTIDELYQRIDSIIGEIETKTK